MNSCERAGEDALRIFPFDLSRLSLRSLIRASPEWIPIIHDRHNLITASH